MNYENLDNEELLRLSLDAINNGRDAESVVMLKTLLERTPDHLHGQYLLAAQHAQLQMYDRAEAGFRTVVAAAPNFAIARFQLGQLLVMKGAADEARQVMAPLVDQPDALGAYARAMSAAANEDSGAAVRELRAGLDLPQEIPALAADMQRLLDLLLQNAQSDSGPAEAVPAQPSAPIFLTGYGRGGA